MIFMLWGRKVGMTQQFASNTHKVVPVTVVDICKWKVLQRKIMANDGYEAVQIGCLRQKYEKLSFDNEWIKNKKKYFLFIKEVRCQENDIFEIGSDFSFGTVFADGEVIKVTGKTIGKGFQGVVKRHRFHGGRAAHGDKLGRKPGALSCLRRQGHVFKGKRMPGHMGNQTKTITGIRVVNFSKENNHVIIKGSIPGKSGSLVCLAKENINERK
jgi:large subunit ribosomal protein L3